MSLAEVVDLLRCPHCAGTLSIIDRSVRCPTGHNFDLARQGYVNLLSGGQPGNADTSEMIIARERFLGGEHYRPLAELIADRVVAAVEDRSNGSRAPRIAELGAGTGYYLSHVLDRLPSAIGLATDVSVAASRRAARAHPRIGAVVADTWARLPIVDQLLDVVLVIFAPRNPDEIARLLRPGGRVIIAGPGSDHLRQLRAGLDLIGIQPDKQDRLRDVMGSRLPLLRQQRLQRQLRLTAADLITVIEMGPNAHHRGTDLADRVATLQPPVDIDLDVWVTEFGS